MSLQHLSGPAKQQSGAKKDEDPTSSQESGVRIWNNHGYAAQLCCIIGVQKPRYHILEQSASYCGCSRIE